MMDIVLSLVALLVGVVIGVLFVKSQFLNKINSEKAIIQGKNEILLERNTRLDDDYRRITKEKEELLFENSRQDAELKNLQTRLEENKKEVEKLQEKFAKDFEILATRILDEKSSKFTEKNKENIESILNPLQEKIKLFEDKVDKTHKESIDYHAALRQQIVGLKELNLQMSKEAINLTKALKGDNKVQGDWGETQLELLLEKANLVKEIHYTTQGGYRDIDGKLKKPDFIVNLPDNRHLIIDSKVSLTSYEAYFNEEDEQKKEEHLKKHIESIRKHFKDLGEKKYESLYEINTPDYVLMFIAIEPAYLLALSKNNQLYLEALDKNVVLVSTSILLATLSTVASMWRQENQKKNVLEIANQAGRLYDQFVNLTDDLIKVGNQLKTVQGSYDTSMKKLTGKGNLIKKVERIKELGAKTSKVMNKTLLDRASED